MLFSLENVVFFIGKHRFRVKTWDVSIENTLHLGIVFNGAMDASIFNRK
jgi:hypothetical protein